MAYHRAVSTLTVVIGAGPGGLAVSRELQRRRIEHRVLESGPSVGTSWRSLYDSLVLHTGKHLSHLPGMPFPRGTPMFPSRNDLVAYLERYSERLPVEPHCTVHRLVRLNQSWRVLTSRGELRARNVIVATGIIANPRLPKIAGMEEFRGGLRHSIEYRNAEPYADRRVLLIGCGNSANEIGSELARHGVRVTLAIRGGANVVPRTVAGVPVQYFGQVLRRLPDGARDAVVRGIRRLSERRHGPSPFPAAKGGPFDAIPMIGFDLVDAIRRGEVALAGDIERFTSGGARFRDLSEREFDEVILATGFAPALRILGDLVRLDEKNFCAPTRSRGQPRPAQPLLCGSELRLGGRALQHPAGRAARRPANLLIRPGGSFPRRFPLPAPHRPVLATASATSRCPGLPVTFGL